MSQKISLCYNKIRCVFPVWKKQESNSLFSMSRGNPELVGLYSPKLIIIRGLGELAVLHKGQVGSYSPKLIIIRGLGEPAVLHEGQVDPYSSKLIII